MMGAMNGEKDDDGTIAAMIAVDNAVELARMQLPSGKSHKYCLSCTEEIPIERRHALPGVKFCLFCQEEKDHVKIRIRVVDHII